MISTWPLDNADYTAEAIGAFSGTRTRGVFSADNNFACTTSSGRTISISTGLAWLKKSEFWGVAVLNSEPISFELDVASGTLSRHVAVVLRLDKDANKSEIVLRYGTLSANPVMPALVRNIHADELFLHSIFQRAGSVEVTTADITDLRLNETYCGIMRDGVTGIPTQQLQSQADALIKQLEDAIKTTLTGAIPDKSVTTAKFADDALAPNGFKPYVHTKTGTTHNLTGTGENGKFKASASGEVSSFTINGTSYPIKQGEESYIELTAGNWYSFIFDGIAVNFKQGGAALNFKVLGGTAQPQNPRENTIWVNTNVTIPKNGYIFSNTQPIKGYVVGTVWIKTGVFQNLSFNSVKNGEMLISVTNAYQWDGTSFALKKIKIYQNGAWLEAYQWFFNRGAGYVGGWRNSPNITHSYSGDAIIVTRQNDNNQNGVTSVKAINFTPFKTLHALTMSPAGQNHGSALGYTFTPTGTLSAYKHLATNGLQKILSLDVSAVNQPGYIALNTNGGAWTTAYFYEIYGEYL